MPSSLHVSLPDEMRQFVDYRTDGKKHFSNPSEYVHTLIREDMMREADRQDVLLQLLKGADDIKQQRFLPLSVIDEIGDRVATSD